MGKGYYSLVQLSTLVSVSFYFSGCLGGNSIKLSEFHKVSLQKSQYAPTDESAQKSSKAKIVIMDIDENGIERAKRIALGKTMATALNKKLSENKNVQVQKRISGSNYKEILSKEIKAAEIGREVGEDVGQADYLVTGQLNNVTFTNKFTEGGYREDKKGKRHYYPPRISYTACVEGVVKVFSLPSLTEAESKSFEECSSRSEEARSPSDAKPSNGSLERDAGEKAMDTVSYDLKNFFSPKAYITDMRENDGDKIIYVSVGKKQGAKEGDKVIIYTMTNDGEVKIGEGKVTNKITNNHSWVTVEELDDDQNIKKGDFVKLIYKEGIFSKGKKWLDKLSKF